jgi:uncharacterized membrane protein
MTNISPAVFGLLTAGSWGLSDFLSRKPAKNIGYFLTATFLQIVGLGEIALYVVLFAPSSLPKLATNPPVLLTNILIGIAAFFSLTFLLRGFSRGNMSIVSPVASTYPVITIFLSAVFLGEIVAGIQAVGIGILLVGIILAGINLRELRRKGGVVMQQDTPGIRNPVGGGGLARTFSASEQDSIQTGQERTNRWITRGLGSALASCLLSGILLFGLGFVTPSFGTPLTVLVLRIASMVTSFALLKPFGQQFKLPSPRIVPWIVVVGTLDVLGLVFFNQGILSAGNSLPIVSTLAGMATVLTIILAGGFYREKLDGIQYLGITLLLIGLGIVLYF